LGGSTRKRKNVIRLSQLISFQSPMGIAAAKYVANPPNTHAEK
jgi:hypothetical protein